MLWLREPCSIGLGDDDERGSLDATRECLKVRVERMADQSADACPQLKLSRTTKANGHRAR